MNIIIKAVESLGFSDNERHVYIEVCVNEGDMTRDKLVQVKEAFEEEFLTELITANLQ